MELGSNWRGAGMNREFEFDWEYTRDVLVGMETRKKISAALDPFNTQCNTDLLFI